MPNIHCIIYAQSSPLCRSLCVQQMRLKTDKLGRAERLTPKEFNILCFVFCILQWPKESVGFFLFSSLVPKYAQKLRHPDQSPGCRVSIGSPPLMAVMAVMTEGGDDQKWRRFKIRFNSHQCSQRHYGGIKINRCRTNI